jgi:hypothetical protein
MSLVLIKKPAGKRNGDVWRLEAKPKAASLKDSPIKIRPSSSCSSSPKESRVNIAVAKPSKEATELNASLERMFDDAPIIVESDGELSATEMAV